MSARQGQEDGTMLEQALQEVDTYSTMTRSLLTLADRLRCLSVTRAAMNDDMDPDTRRAALQRLVQRQGTSAERDRALAHAGGGSWGGAW
ncbi:hypothetical protein [[Actinomadura] parvosata]|nr:hypothetical protein [Nonomuraea sp. ATCC 55076]